MTTPRGITYLLLTASLFWCLGVDETIAAERERIWTPSELIGGKAEAFWKGRSKLVVRFRVDAIRFVPTRYPDGSERRVLHLVPFGDLHTRNDFSVPISTRVLAALKRGGIRDIEDYFLGKIVEVKGKISATPLHLILSDTKWTYHINVRKLEQLIRVEPDPAASPRSRFV